MHKLPFEEWKESVLGRHRFVADSHLRRLWYTGLAPFEAVAHCEKHGLFTSKAKRIGRPSTVGARRLPWLPYWRVVRDCRRGLALGGLEAIEKLQKHSVEEDSVAYLRAMKERLTLELEKAARAKDENS